MAKEFERELDEYISTRKGKPFSFKEFVKPIIPKLPKRAPAPKNVEVYEDKPEEKVEEKKLSPSDELIRARVYAEETKEDIKRMATITLGVVKDLPDEHVKKFRSSDEFDDLRTILKKHNFIK